MVHIKKEKKKGKLKVFVGPGDPNISPSVEITDKPYPGHSGYL